MGRVLEVLGLRSSLENPNTPLSNPAAWLVELFGGGDTGAGVPVTPRSSLQVTTVYACVRILADGIGMLPLILYERLPGGGRDRAELHPLYELLHDEPSEYHTSCVWRELMMASAALWGNGYARIRRNGAGRPTALLWLEPWAVRPARVRGQVVYEVTLVDGGREVLPAQDVFHLPALSVDGLQGLSPVQVARRTIGLAAAAEEFGSRFFGNGARPGGVLEHPGTLKKEARDNLRDSWQKMHQGPHQGSRVAILEEGVKYAAIGIPPEDAQFLETRKFQVADIARLFRVPPHLVGDLERATNNNIEQQSLDFVIHTLGPWFVRWEQEIRRKLLLLDERRRFFAEFLVDGLLRGDLKSRYDAYAVARQWGWMSADDVRRRENQNPLPDGRGTTYLQPLNMVAAPPAGEEPAASSPDLSPAARAQLDGILRSLTQDHAARVLRREARAVLRLVNKATEWAEHDRTLAGLLTSVAEVRADTARDLAPVMAAHLRAAGKYAARSVEEWQALAERFAADYAGRHAARTASLLAEVARKPHAEARAAVEAWPDLRVTEVVEGIRAVARGEVHA